MPLVGQGGQHTWEAVVRDAGQVLTDAATLQITVRDPLGSVVDGYPQSIGSGVVDVGVGLYENEWDVPADADLGTYTAQWAGILNGAPINGSDTVDVVAPGSVGPTPGPTWSYDLATATGQLRLLIDDRDLSAVSSAIAPRKRSAIFSDEELAVFLDDARAGGNVNVAAALALITIAGNRQLLVQSRRIGDTVVDFGPVRKDLLAQAAALVGGERQLEILTAPAPADAIVEVGWTDFAREQIVTNASLRDVPLP